MSEMELATLSPKDSAGSRATRVLIKLLASMTAVTRRSFSSSPTLEILSLATKSTLN